MRQMLDTRSSAASATQLSRLCKPSSKTVDNADGGVYQNLGISPSSSDLLFVRAVFIKRKKSMNLYEQKFGNPQRVPCPDLVAVFRQKKAVASLTTWSRRAFLNTVQLHPLWVKHYQPDREDNQALLVGLPVGEGDALVQSFVEDLWAVESIKFMQKILKVYLSWRSDQFCWINGKKESICQELHLQLFLFQCSHLFKRTYVDKIRTSVGAPLIPIHSLHAGFALFLAGSLRWGRTIMHSMGRSSRWQPTTSSTSLSRIGKIPNFLRLLETCRNYDLLFSKFFFVDLRDCLKTVQNLINKIWF